MPARPNAPSVPSHRGAARESFPDSWRPPLLHRLISIQSKSNLSAITLRRETSVLSTKPSGIGANQREAIKESGRIAAESRTKDQQHRQGTIMQIPNSLQLSLAAN